MSVVADRQEPLPSPAQRPRWYAPTPAKFLFAVLAMQGVLFLSAHYRWFWFNERKGYTVLITVTATMGALLLLFAAVVVSRFFIKSQFSLATLLLMVPVAAIPCGWLAWEMEIARQQRDLRELAKSVSTEPKDLSENWLTEILGQDLFSDVRAVDFSDKAITDVDVRKLKPISNLRWLNLHGTQVTDAGLEHLKGLTRLQYLYLEETQVTDAGLERLQGLTQLHILNFRETQVTDAGLLHLKGLTQLQTIYLGGRTQVTDTGVDQLKIALPKCLVVR